jgi:hypothetical protein
MYQKKDDQHYKAMLATVYPVAGDSRMIDDSQRIYLCFGASVIVLCGASRQSLPRDATAIALSSHDHSNQLILSLWDANLNSLKLMYINRRR